MKSFLKRVVEQTARSPIGWRFYGGCKRISNALERVHWVAQNARDQDFIKGTAHELFPELIVAHGPFQGLCYPSAESVASALLPKLLGSYESELHAAIEELLKNRYDSVVDIGCAEGYYAVGFALRLPQAEVFAYDLNPHAQRACAEMAKLNKVAGRVHINGMCDEEVLRTIPLGERSLILSDCEGYESALFTHAVAEYLVKHDLIIETHDMVDMETSDKIRAALSGTHDIHSIRSLDDIEKAHRYIYPELASLGVQARYRILREERANIMEWVVATSRAH
jgi:hypothetical protein